jgi:chromosomal replication initiation ATPase DnaA
MTSPWSFLTSDKALQPKCPRSRVPPIHDLKKVEDRVCELCTIGTEYIYSKSREKVKARARGLFRYRAVRELGMSNTEVGKKLGISQPAVGYALRRGEALAKEHDFHLEE